MSRRSSRGPTAAPWIETPEYVEALVGIWGKKRCIAVVAELGSKLLQYVRLTHPTPPLHVVCPRYGAYAEIDRIEHQVLALMPDIVLLSCGPTATVLAHRLCVAGPAGGRPRQRRRLPAALAREWPAARRMMRSIGQNGRRRYGPANNG